VVKAQHEVILTEIFADESPDEMNLYDLCQMCHTETDLIIDMVNHGLLNPSGRSPANWHFHRNDLYRLQRARRLQKDLEINLAGIALVFDLLEELEQLRARVKRLDNDVLL